MKRHLYRIFSCLFVAVSFATQSPMVLAAQDDVGVVQGRVVNVMDPIDEQDVATKKYVDNLIEGIPELPAVLQSTGKSETAVMSQQAVTNAINNHITFDMIYPIGSIYMSVISVDPNVLFGGTWEKLENNFLIGASSSYVVNSTGGNSSITLSTSNMPNHTHSFSATTGSSGSHSHTIGRDFDGAAGSARSTVHAQGVSGAQYTSATSTDGSHTHSVSGATDSTGSGSSFSIMPPYLAVYMWKRIA